MTESIEVAAAVVEREGRILVTRRPPGKHLAGYWEFPGGKRRAEETLEACLHREMAEELDVEVEIVAPLLDTTHDYDDRRVRLCFYRCRLAGGVPRAVEVEELRWVTRQELGTLAFPPADRELIDLLAGRRA